MNKYERSAGERWADKVNSWVVNLVFLIHIIIQLVRSPDPIPMSAKDTKPTLLVTLSGLAGPRKFWSGFVRHLVGTLPPETLSEWSWMAQGNVEAAEVPMHREVREKTWPAVLRHCERFGSEARVVLTGHSLGSVDALWIACEIRERFGGRVPVLLLSVAGAFGTARAPVLYSLGVHRTVVESIGTRSAPFLRELLGRCRTLPFHPRSRSLFVMASDDGSIRPPPLSLVYDFPTGYKNLSHVCMHGCGHSPAIMASYERLALEVQRFL